jgi:hypothetical protein
MSRKGPNLPTILYIFCYILYMFNKINIHSWHILAKFQGFFICLRKGEILPLFRYNKWDNVYQTVYTYTI